MNPSIYCILIIIMLLPLYHILTRKTSKMLPPGSLGLPIIGQSLSLLHALDTNTTEKWFQDRIRKYGPISKLSLFGTPTVFLHGQAANKFIYTCNGNALANQQPPSIRMICGEMNITEMSGNDNKRVRGALVSFLKPEVLKQDVGKMDEEIRKHLEMQWHGKHGHDTSSILITFLVRLLASDPSVRANLVQEQEEIAESKASGELLTWDDLAKMKYTWQVALETLRMNPALLGSFRKALRDLEYNGYVIPKGWQIYVILASSMTHMDEQLFPDPSKFDPTRFEQQAPPFSFVELSRI